MLAMIFNQLAAGNARDELSEEMEMVPTRKTYRQALASSAVTARVLSCHALDVLWRELDDIWPLLELFPHLKCVESLFVGPALYYMQHVKC